jgi:hypothetical protein
MALSSGIPPLPTHTLRYRSDLDEEDIYLDETVVLYEDATEDRALLPIWNKLQLQKTRKLVIIRFSNPNTKEEITLKIDGQDQGPFSLRDESKIAEILNVKRLILDLSGLPHQIWAPLFKMSINYSIPTRVIYTEPEKYKLHPNPASSTIFDLSVSFDGLAPLPGFARLSGPEDESKCLFIPMLGFEGNRPERLLFDLDPPPKVIPVVGVPGFQMEFPAYTIACNRELIENSRSQSEIRWAKASCPFEAFDALDKIRNDYPEHYLYIAPVGTKPHSLAAVWFSIVNPNISEILYDNPVRKVGRADGIGVIHIYDFSGKM